MLVMGIVSVLLGVLVISSEKYEIKYVENRRKIVEKEVVEKDGLYKYKILLGIFAIVLGVFMILNYIIF